MLVSSIISFSHNDSKGSFFKVIKSWDCVKELILYRTFKTLNDPKKEGFWKQWEKEKMLVRSIFFFSHNVFYFIKERKPSF